MAAGAGHRVLSSAAAIVAVSALGGAVGMATGWLSIGVKLNQRLPFHSPVFGGVALAAVVGVPFALLAVWAWTGDGRTGMASVAAGVSLVGWLVVELLVVRKFSFFHPTYTVVGVGFVLAGRSNFSSGPASAADWRDPD
jgi:hypothetical protein